MARLIVPGDRRGGRSVRNVESITCGAGTADGCSVHARPRADRPPGPPARRAGRHPVPQDLRADLHWLLAAYRDALLAVEMAWLDREVVTSMAHELATLAVDAQGRHPSTPDPSTHTKSYRWWGRDHDSRRGSHREEYAGSAVCSGRDSARWQQRGIRAAAGDCPGRRADHLRGGVAHGRLQRAGRDLRSQQPGSRVRFNYGASSALRTQLEQGARRRRLCLRRHDRRWTRPAPPA